MIVSRRDFLKLWAQLGVAAVAPRLLSGCGGGEPQKREGADADLHMHLQSQREADLLVRVLGPTRSNKENTAADLVYHLDLIGAKRAFALSGGQVWGSWLIAPLLPGLGLDEYEEVKAENNWAITQAALYPDRLVPFFSVNPLKAYALEEVERCVQEFHLNTLKLHFYASGVCLREPDHLAKVKNLFARADELHLRLLIHPQTYDADFYDRGPEIARIFIREVLALHPGLKVQLAHLGGGGLWMEDLFGAYLHAFHEDRLEKKNIYFDFSYTIFDPQQWPEIPPGYYEPLADQLRSWGLERIFWGSDFRLADPETYAPLTRQLVTLTAAEYNQIVSHDGQAFLD